MLSDRENKTTSRFSNALALVMMQLFMYIIIVEYEAHQIFCASNLNTHTKNSKIKIDTINMMRKEKSNK